ncbi:MAG: hypothetical protein NO474_01835, partial [Methanomassiliicoccales archaeon]|nr:hypothetical protein [Methanomassiliicoccales archaeon]
MIDGDSLNEFEKDLEVLFERLVANIPVNARDKLLSLVTRLIELRDRNMLKINHSVLELVVAKNLILNGYEVKLEYDIRENLACDVWA